MNELITNLHKILQYLAEFQTFLNKNQLTQYDLDTTKEMVEYFLEKAPFQPGDIVFLTKTPEINEKKAWGWLASKHFLKKGAQGKIVKFSWINNKKLYFLVSFKNQSWIDKDGIEHLQPYKDQFCFCEDDLSKRDPTI